MSKLVRAIVKNLKGVDEIDVLFGDITEIAGEEAAGKSSFIDGVLWAFQGTRPIQDDPIRDGQMGARTILETDKVVITREYLDDPTKPNGYRTTLKIKGKDGGTYNQSYLNEVFPNLVDPSKFFDMQPAEVVQTLLGFLSEGERSKLAEINTQLAKREEERLFCSRTLKKMGVPEKVEEAESVSISELNKQRDEILEYNAAQNRIYVLKHAYEDNVRRAETEVETLKKKLEIQQEYLDELKAKKPKEPAPYRSTDEIDVQISNAEEINARYAAYQNYLRHLDERKDVERDHEIADERIKELRAEKKKIMAEATLPGDNPVEITGDSEVLINGRPMDQLSTSEKILFSAELAMAHNSSPDDSGRIRTLVIRRGESLGTKTYDRLCSLREKYNYQLLIESVGDGHSSDAIILEEGKIKGLSKEDKKSTTNLLK